MNIKSALPGNDVGYKKERQKHARAQEHVCAPVHKYIESSTIKKKKGEQRRRLGRLRWNAACGGEQTAGYSNKAARRKLIGRFAGERRATTPLIPHVGVQGIHRNDTQIFSPHRFQTPPLPKPATKEPDAIGRRGRHNGVATRSSRRTIDSGSDTVSTQQDSAVFLN